MPNGYSGRRVLVTGASGFIGARLCVRLHDEGAVVHGVSRTPREEGSVEWHAGDVTNREQVQAIFARVRPQVVFHLAGETRAARDLALVPLTLDSNLVSSVHVMAAAVESGIERVVMAGSQEEPAEGAPDSVPTSPYAASKWAATRYARMFHALYGLSTISLRIFMVYGPEQRDLAKLIPHVIRTLLQGQAPVINSGERRVDWIHVADVAEALALAGRAPGIDGAQIDVGSGRPVTIREIVETLAALVAPEIRPVYRGTEFARPFEQERVANVDAAFRTLGWRPRIPIEQGLRETVDWLKGRLEAS
jgi:UDP-glucose 4-epimerase